METYPYLFKVSAGLIAFYALYWFVLQRHTYFRFNRFFLLTAVFTSFLAPFIELPAETVTETLTIQDFSNFTVQNVVAESQSFSTTQILWGIYWIVVAIMLIRFLYRLFRLSQFIRQSEHFKMDGFNIAISSNSNLPTFSFLKWLVVNPKDYEQYFDTVLQHEVVHIQQWHSLDLLLIEIAHCFMWFNPILIFYKKSFKEIHEYLADDHATPQDRNEYAMRLFGYVYDVQPLPFVNQFFDHSTLKNRIKMLYQKRSSRWVLGRYLFAIPLLAILITLVAARVANSPENGDKIKVQGRVLTADGKGLVGVNVVVKNETKGTQTDDDGKYELQTEVGKTLVFTYVGYGNEERVVNKEKINVLMEETSLTTNSLHDTPPTPPAQTSSNGIFNVVEETPQFEGGPSALISFIKNNLKYPTAAVNAKIEGTVFVNFVIDENGKIKDIKILRGVGYGCDEEAIRLMSIMPAWKPGMQNGKKVAVRYNMPFEFKLDSSKPNPEWQFNSPLYIVDGKILEKFEEVQALDPQNIESMSVLKGPNATTKYGDKAQKGAIIIKTKKSTEGVAPVLNQLNPNSKFGENTIKPKPYILLDGKEITNEQLEDTTFINPKNIEKMEVFKGQDAASYGEKGKNGVIIITTKKK